MRFQDCNEIGRYSEIFFNQFKWWTLVMAQVFHDVPGLVAFPFSDGRLFCIWVTETKGIITPKLMRRTDRGLKNDVEPGVLIPLEKMVEVE